ncbi:hypothetical protein Glove_391g9 [Diversispora epigaea]|uniref:Uncharacterized protein n=1 Tax=Diversispora epigaea TaxID=1348612 RepID=A0A397H2P6_9GLOM|nr:hypothetical protein Glove_391g9 [Diversispora epigaea]
MPKRKKFFMRLQEYNNKRQQISVDKNKETETNEEFETDEKSVEAKEREEKEIEEEEKIQTRLLATALIWNKLEKNQRTVKGIPKTTYYRKFGTSGVLANAAKGIPKINIFWKNKKFLNGFAGGSSNGYVNEPTISSLISPMPSDSLAEMDENSILSERIAQLRCDLLRNGKTLTAFEYNRQRAVYEYFV